MVTLTALVNGNQIDWKADTVAHWFEYKDFNSFDELDKAMDEDEIELIGSGEGMDVVHSMDLDFIKEVYRLVNGHDDWTINPDSGSYVLDRLEKLIGE